MSGVFNTGLSFWQSVGLIFSIAISAIAIKVTFNFDVNKYLERKDDKNLSKLRNTCTHIEISPADNDKVQIRFLYESPSGTLSWQCQRCGLVMNSEEYFKSRADYYINNQAEYVKQQKKFQKLLRKNGMV